MIVPQRTLLLQVGLLVVIVLTVSIFIQYYLLEVVGYSPGNTLMAGWFNRVPLLAVEVAILYAFRREIDRHLYALYDAQLRAETANNTKSQFLSNMSHELQTPLTVIDMAVANLTEGTYRSGYPAPPEQMALLEPAQRNVYRLRDLIDSILEFSALGSVTYSTDPIRGDLSWLIRDMDDLRLVAERKGLQLDLIIEPSAPTSVYEVPKLQRILTNLVSNAIKFTPFGYVKVSIAGMAEKWEIIVEDTGIGISQEYLDRIFQPFFQVENTDSRTFQGVGLGLTIVRTLAMQLGGSVTVTSTPGVGSKFVVTLPNHTNSRGSSSWSQN